MPSDEPDEEWMHRPPYRTRRPQDAFEVKHRGSCHCGKVEYELSRDRPLATKICHCIECQLQHYDYPFGTEAAPCQWAAIFEKTDISFAQGHRNLEWYDPAGKKGAHALPCKVRCRSCHTPIMDEGRRMILVFPALLRLGEADRGKFKPEMHIFYESRVVDLPDGTPKWSGMNRTSELVADSPADMVEKYRRR